MLLTRIDKDFHPLETVAVTSFSICQVVMGKEVQTSLKIMSSEHSIKEFHSANRLSGLGFQRPWRAGCTLTCQNTKLSILHILGKGMPVG